MGRVQGGARAAFATPSWGPARKIFLFALKRASWSDKPKLHLNKNAGLQVPVAFAGVVQELIACRKNDGRVVAILNVESATCTPKHLVVLAEQVAKITCSNRQNGSPNGQAHPKATGQRHKANIVEFLIPDAHASKNHLVNGIPQMTIKTHVEITHVAHAIAETALSI